MRYCCADCDRAWDYPVETCIFCGGQINKLDINDFVVKDVISVSIPSEDHPITPYYVMLLRDNTGSYRFQKTFQHHDIGKTVQITGEQCGRCTIGIIGTGITGTGIAEVALRTGNAVILKSRSQGSLKNALEKLSRNLSKGMNTEEAQILLNDVITTTDYNSLID